MKTYIYSCLILLLTLGSSCKTGSKLPKITPAVITEKTGYDSDDPAIWYNEKAPEKSIVFGTDKSSDGAVYAFDLSGKILPEKTLKNIRRPNNVDIAYKVRINDSTYSAVLAFTEREKRQIRLYSIPEMKPLDNGGFPVFSDETTVDFDLPMGIALYRPSNSEKLYAIVSRKQGPKSNYLYQYELTANQGVFQSKLVRKFGAFSGKKEIEAIVVDNELGHVYYSDEQHGIRKYYADPKKGSEELACFGGEHFEEDIEGIALIKTTDTQGYLIVSNQQKGEFNLFNRENNAFVKAVNLGTTATDGCDGYHRSMGPLFPNGIFVAMNDDKNFYFYDLATIIP